MCTGWPDLKVGHWGRARVPFPVSVPYRQRPDLARLGSVVHGRFEAQVLDADAGAPATLRAKWARLQALPGRCVALAPRFADDPVAVWRRVAAAAGALAGHGMQEAGAVGEGTAPSSGSAAGRPLDRVGDTLHATLAGWSMPADPDAPFALRPLRPDAEPVLRWIASRPVAERPLHALGLALQEDLAWVEADAPGEAARAMLLHVCWPSGWDPAVKVGMDFATLHAPVADADLLRASARPLSRALLSQGPFVRFVWTLAPDGAPSRHPADEPAAPEAAPWFRCERQVSMPVAGAPDWPGGLALFLIRLHVAPLDTVADTAARRAVLREALASMSAATLAYKGLAGRVDGWRARLAEPPGPTSPPAPPRRR
ncbi:MAG: heme-dependent oxidative N-demethylase subunit alpha family protein [Burkholderiales bacterium]